VAIAPAPSVFIPSYVNSDLLDSNFILPPNVTIEFDVNNVNNTNLQPLSPENNPQAGSLVPEAFKDANLNTTADPDAVSGYKTAFEIKLI